MLLITLLLAFLVLLQVSVTFKLYEKSIFVKLFFTLVSMLCEKNPVKASTLNTPLVFSMSRCIMAAVATAVVRLIWNATNLGWPDATLGMAVVLSPALLAAMSKVSPHEALEFGKVLLNRFGIGAVKQDTPADHETLIDRSEPEPIK